MFDRNQKEFPTCTHRYIWACGVTLMPPKISCAKCTPYDTSRFGDLYRFKAGAYLDMYRNPHIYGIDCEKIEQERHGQQWRQAMVSAKHRRQKDRLQILESRNLANLPENFTERLISHMICVDGRYALPKTAFDASFIDQYNKIYKNTHVDILKLIERMEIKLEISGDYVLLSSTPYPLLFDALAQWQSLTERSQKSAQRYRVHAALRYLDCRIFQPDYTVTLESSQYYMSHSILEYMTQIEQFLSTRKLKLKKPDNTHALSLGCDFKGEHLFYFTLDSEQFVCRTNMFARNSPEYAKFEREVEKLSNAAEIKAFCHRGLNRCRKCGCHPVPPAKLGYWTEVFGKKVNLCGGRRCFETNDFSQYSCDIMKKLMEINYTIIQERAKA